MKKIVKIITGLLVVLNFVFGQFTADPEVVTFSPVTVDSSSQITVSLTSDIAQTVTLSGVDSPYTLSATELVYVTASSTIDFTVDFTPTTAATYLDTINISGSIFGNTTLLISGEGTLVEIDLSDNVLSFGEISLGDSTYSDITITNAGTGTMVVGPITSSDNQFYATPDTFLLASDESQTISIYFRPTLAGDHSATLSIPSNDPITPVGIVSLSGTGVTNISGSVSGTWTTINSPYYLVGNTTVPDGDILTIDPGVTVIFEDEYDFDIYGSLVTIGTETDSIIFLGNGGRIRLYEPDNAIEFTYCVFKGNTHDFNGDFENSDELVGWTYGGTYDLADITANNPHSGSYSFQQSYGNSWSSYSSNVYSPTFKVVDDVSSISFNYRTDWYDYWDYSYYFYVQVNNSGDWIQLDYDDHEQTSWQSFSVDLSSYADAGDVIQFRWYNNWYYYFYFYLDNIELVGIDAVVFSKAPRIEISSGSSGGITMNHSRIINPDGHAISSSLESTPITINHSVIKNSAESGIYHSGQYSSITVNNSTIIGNEGYGIYSTGSYDTIRVNHSTINENNEHGIYSGDTHVPIILNDVNVSTNNQSGVYSSSNHSPITADSVFVEDNGDHGIFTGGSHSSITITNSIIRANENDGVNSNANSAPIRIDQSLISANGSEGIYSASNQVIINYCTVIDNYREGLNINNSYSAQINNSIFSANDIVDQMSQIRVPNSLFSNFNIINGFLPHDIDQGTGNQFLDPLIIDRDGRLSNNSPAIDAANPNHQDHNMPHGLGTIRADAGLYGGPNNFVWGGDTLPSGVPNIDNIEDLPQDQGGQVGIQYQASAFDHAHTAYDIEEYSFWRAMDLARNGVIDVDSDIVMETRNEYWELVGSMPAQGFEQYGFSAATLGDSTESSGIVWSKYIVIAHTSDDDVSFVSEPDSGYSVDNIAPFAPSMVNSYMDENGLLTLEWNIPENSDVLYHDIYRDGEPFLTVEEQTFTDSYSLGDQHYYTIRGIDVNENIGAFSEPFDFNLGISGDVTWDGSVDVLDVLSIASIIISGTDDYSENELWAAQMNSDGTVDIYDLVLVVDHIMSGGSARLLSSDGQAIVYQKANTVFLSADAPVAGLQLLLSEPVMDVYNGTSLEIMHRDQTVLLYSFSGDYLMGNGISLIELPEGVNINQVKVSGPGGEQYAASLGVVPDQFAVHQNFPNPFNPVTQLKVDLAEMSHLTIKVYDASGREVREIIDQDMAPGFHQFSWNGKDGSGHDVASGVYFFRILIPENVKTVKAILLR